MDEFDILCKKAKRCVQKNDRNNLEKGLKYYLDAYKLNPSEKLKNRIDKITNYIECKSDSDNDKENEEGDEMIHLGQGFYLYKPLYDRIFDYQREGVLFLFKLYQQKQGGILGDDMGLGKTIQVCAFLSGMFDSKRIKNVLIVMPVALLINWQNEFNDWAPGLDVYDIHEAHNRNKVIDKLHKKGGVGLLTYGLLKVIADLGDAYEWDYMILDEGHQIKNPAAKTTKYVIQIQAKNRLIISGTPIMNNLNELWCLFNWTNHGTLLGQAHTFNLHYGNPITRSKKKDASSAERAVGDSLMINLKEMIDPFILRRTKADIRKFCINDPRLAHMLDIPIKNDFVCWIKLTEEQIKIYNDFNSSDDVKLLLNSKKSPLVALTILKKICDHPRVLSNRQCNKLGLTTANETDSDALDRLMDDSTSFSVEHLSDEILVNESGKMNFLIKLLEMIKSEGHKCLLFSRSKRVLTIVEKLLQGRQFVHLRLDGEVSKVEERQKIIELFQTSKKVNLLLLTVQVGGVGLTLTAATRVIIFDPSWNPATDSQAVDRACRIGQKENVVVYRLITCGSVEEKIYRRQIFKDSINKTIMGDAKNPVRHFSAQDLRELFTLDNPEVSATQLQLQEDHKDKLSLSCALESHLMDLENLEVLFGISHHNFMFDEENVNNLVEDENAKIFAQSKVSSAFQQLKIDNDEDYLSGNKNRALSNIENIRAPRKNRIPSNLNVNNNILQDEEREEFDGMNEYYEKHQMENKMDNHFNKPSFLKNSIKDEYKLNSDENEDYIDFVNDSKNNSKIDEILTPVPLHNITNISPIFNRVSPNICEDKNNKRRSIFKKHNSPIVDMRHVTESDHDHSIVNPVRKNKKYNIIDDDDDNNERNCNNYVSSFNHGVNYAAADDDYNDDDDLTNSMGGAKQFNNTKNITNQETTPCKSIFETASPSSHIIDESNDIIYNSPSLHNTSHISNQSATSNRLSSSDQSKNTSKNCSNLQSLSINNDDDEDFDEDDEDVNPEVLLKYEQHIAQAMSFLKNHEYVAAFDQFILARQYHDGDERITAFINSLQDKINR